MLRSCGNASRVVLPFGEGIILPNIAPRRELRGSAPAPPQRLRICALKQRITSAVTAGGRERAAPQLRSPAAPQPHSPTALQPYSPQRHSAGAGGAGRGGAAAGGGRGGAAPSRPVPPPAPPREEAGGGRGRSGAARGAAGAVGVSVGAGRVPSALPAGPRSALGWLLPLPSGCRRRSGAAAPPWSPGRPGRVRGLALPVGRRSALPRPWRRRCFVHLAVSAGRFRAALGVSEPRGQRPGRLRRLSAGAALFCADGFGRCRAARSAAPRLGAL
mgnify:CR=1 FL=1